MDFCFAEDRERTFDQADILWSADIDPSVLALKAELTAHSRTDAIDLMDLADRLVVVEGPAWEHLLLCRAGLTLRLDIVSGTALAGPVRLRPRLEVPARASQLATLVRLMALAGVRGIGRWRLHPDMRIVRMAQALRAADAAAAGLTQREIAVLFDVDAVSDWPGLGSSIQSRVRRRISLGRKMVADGPAPILGRSTRIGR